MRKPILNCTLALFAVGLVACHQGPATTSAPKSALANPVDCKGESYVAVNNPSNASLDVYAYIGGGPGTYIGTASPGTARVSLAGTALDHKNGTLYGMQNGRIVTNAGMPNTTFSITRRCDSTQ